MSVRQTRSFLCTHTKLLLLPSALLITFKYFWAVVTSPCVTLVIEFQTEVICYCITVNTSHGCCNYIDWLPFKSINASPWLVTYPAQCFKCANPCHKSSFFATNTCQLFRSVKADDQLVCVCFGRMSALQCSIPVLHEKADSRAFGFVSLHSLGVHICDFLSAESLPIE